MISRNRISRFSSGRTQGTLHRQPAPKSSDDPAPTPRRAFAFATGEGNVGVDHFSKVTVFLPRPQRDGQSAWTYQTVVLDLGFAKTSSFQIGTALNSHLLVAGPDIDKAATLARFQIEKGKRPIFDDISVEGLGFTLFDEFRHPRSVTGRRQSIPLGTDEFEFLKRRLDYRVLANDGQLHLGFKVIPPRSFIILRPNPTDPKTPMLILRANDNLSNGLPGFQAFYFNTWYFDVRETPPSDWHLKCSAAKASLNAAFNPLESGSDQLIHLVAGIERQPFFRIEPDPRVQSLRDRAAASGYRYGSSTDRYGGDLYSQVRW